MSNDRPLAFDTWQQIIWYGREYDKYDGVHRELTIRSRDGGVWQAYWETPDEAKSEKLRPHSLHSEPELALVLLADRLKTIVERRKEGKK